MLKKARALGLVTATVLAVSPFAKAADFMDLDAVDRAVAEFTGAAIGQSGGARAPVDRRMRLAVCSAPLALDWYGRAQDTVVIGCPVAGGWRVFVPVAGAQSQGFSQQQGQRAAVNSNRTTNGPVVVARGETVSIAVSGSGFTLTRQGQAMDAGAVGDWIRVKPQGNKADPVRARIIRAGVVGMDLP